MQLNMVSNWHLEVKMGTYTANKELFMPSIGEQGWGELVNNNFSTIDTFLKPITVSGSTYTFTGNQTGGSISATSISNSGTLTQTGTSTFTGKITANGGIGTKALTTTSISNSGTITSTGNITSSGTINGVTLKSTITVTPNTTTVTTSSLGTSYSSYDLNSYLWLLPPIGLQKYTGSIKIHNPNTERTGSIFYSLNPSMQSMTSLNIAKSSYGTISFTNASCLFLIAGNSTGAYCYLCGFTLS